MKQEINCVIVDDDPYAIEILEDYISKMPGLVLGKSYTDPVAALYEMTIGYPIDILFLDIDMPGISGLKFAEQVREVAPNVIFTTGHIHYGPDAFKVRAKHYLVKPIDQLDFIEAISSVVSGLGLQKEEVPVEISFARTHISNERIKIEVKDIVLIESDKNYVNIITERKVYRVYMTVKEMAEKLKHNKNFYQVRKSAIINAHYINRIDGNTIDLVKWEVVMTKEFKKDLAHFIDSNTLTSNRC